MGPLWLLALIAGLSFFGYVLGRWKSVVLSGKGALAARPGYYGAYVLVWTAMPALAILIVLSLAKPLIVDRTVRANLPETVLADTTQLSLQISGVEQVAAGLKLATPDELQNIRIGVVTARSVFARHGLPLGEDVKPYQLVAAGALNVVSDGLDTAIDAAVVAALAFGLIFAFARVRPRLRARNLVENTVLALLIAASSVAILTTVGIVLSLLFQALQFFSMVSPINFYFGTIWDPRFAAAGSTESGQFGFLPLFWGTIYISFFAMLVAVPVGLFSAVYMAEYAGSKVRSIAKPLIEILAGIPTIVYGFFALTTIGPFIRDWLAVPLGLGTSGNNVLTAGLVMGIMIIPYVSSLSDDIITAVPRSLRDGSLALGATRSETMRQVILPAALPGVVGAVLLAVSRAIGETMIVVLAAGVAARASLNPFAEMTTITVKIVNQLTGDLEFTSPQTLVAFALGITLFVITLGLNVLALTIVRKYREQYE
ncbi:phosphate ABC transporter permease subunit PstC [Pleomorphomonas koreensis]|uniref:phosphate ABC transporter permease subunit PstC n=1 Tax=Pleomorphomonas koreensis TaxID=257440 RepID=UPI0004234DCC|nr:phosphate ABC transporter permease subunit PstC [Pleomorphomonas koreensis]